MEHEPWDELQHNSLRVITDLRVEDDELALSSGVLMRFINQWYDKYLNADHFISNTVYSEY